MASTNNKTPGFFVAELVGGPLTDGKPLRKRIFGFDKHQRQEALEMLHEQGYEVPSLRYQKRPLLEKELFTHEQALIFMESIASHVDSDGSTMVRAIESVIRSQPSERIQTNMQPVLDVLKRTSDPVAALEEGQFLPVPVLSILRAGQRTNQMPRALTAAVELMRKMQAAGSSVKGSLGFLLSEGGSTVAAVLGFRQMMMPLTYTQVNNIADATVRAKGQADLAMLQWSLDIFLGTHALGVLFVLALSAMLMFGRGNAKAAAEQVLLRIPVIGRLLLDSAMSASFAVAGYMMSGQARRVEAMKVAADSTRFELVARMWRNAHDGVKRGFSELEALRSPLLTYSDLQRLNGAGALDQMEVARVFLRIGEERSRLMESSALRVKRVADRLMVFYVGFAIYVLVTYSAVSNTGVTSAMKAALKNL